jgi:excisionase family DNA binding protein
MAETIKTTLDDFITTTKACQLLGVSKTVIKRMVDQGEIDSWRTTGGHRRLSKASVLAWLEVIHGASNMNSPIDHTVRVMILDDDPVTQPIIADYFDRFFADVDYEQAMDGYEGLVKAGQGNFDLILVDLHMPKMDGYAAIDALQSLDNTQHTTIVVITGDERQNVDMNRLGRERVVLTKPVALDVIGQFVRYEKAIKSC